MSTEKFRVLVIGADASGRLHQLLLELEREYGDRLEVIRQTMAVAPAPQCLQKKLPKQSKQQVRQQRTSSWSQHSAQARQHLKYCR